MELSAVFLKVVNNFYFFTFFILLKNSKGGKTDDNRKENAQLIVCLAYNCNFHYFSPVFFALLQSKSKLAYRVLHQQILLMREKFNPKIITVDFEIAHIEVC